MAYKKMSMVWYKLVGTRTGKEYAMTNSYKRACKILQEICERAGEEVRIEPTKEAEDDTEE